MNVWWSAPPAHFWNINDDQWAIRNEARNEAKVFDATKATNKKRKRSKQRRWITQASNKNKRGHHDEASEAKPYVNKTIINRLFQTCWNVDRTKWWGVFLNERVWSDSITQKWNLIRQCLRPFNAREYEGTQSQERKTQDHHRAAGDQQHLTVRSYFMRIRNRLLSGRNVGPGKGREASASRSITTATIRGHENYRIKEKTTTTQDHKTTTISEAEFWGKLWSNMNAWSWL